MGTGWRKEREQRKEDVSEFSRETDLVDVYTEIYHDESVHTIMEAEKSHSLLSASWKPRHVRGLIQSESEGLRTWGANGLNSSWKTGKDGKSCHNSAVRQEAKKGINSSFLHLLDPQRIGQCPPTFAGGYQFIGASQVA